MMKGYYNYPLPHEDDGEVFSLEDWIELVSVGAVNHYDGSGYQATLLGYDRTLDAFAMKADDCTHIIWFNK